MKNQSFIVVLLLAILPELVFAFNANDSNGASGVSDTELLQKAINDAGSKGVPLVLEKNRKYIIDKPLTFPSNVTLNGNGSFLSPSSGWVANNERYSGMINLVNVNAVKINNWTIDLKGESMYPDAVFTAIFMLGAKNCHLFKINFLNSGTKYSPNSLPNSPFILMLSQDGPNEFSYVVKKYKNIVGGSTGNIIEACNFKNENTYAGFAIRMLTNWLLKKPVESFKYTTSGNKILGSSFIGDFEWNTIELAGGGTKKNVVSGNNITGKSINNIDLDKGASDNLISNNILSNVGLPKRYAFNNNVRCSPIMVHGIQGTANQKNYPSRNNIVELNTIDNIINPEKGGTRFLYSGGIGASDVEGLVIRGNILKNLYNNKNYGGGIVLDQSCSNVSISSNTITNANWGVVFTPNGKLLKDVKIKDNEISTKRIGVFLAAGSSDRSDNISIDGNRISQQTPNANEPAIFVGKNFKLINVSSNKINGKYKKDNSIKVPKLVTTLKGNTLN